EELDVHVAGKDGQVSVHPDAGIRLGESLVSRRSCRDRSDVLRFGLALAAGMRVDEIVSEQAVKRRLVLPRRGVPPTVGGSPCGCGVRVLREEERRRYGDPERKASSHWKVSPEGWRWGGELTASGRSCHRAW